MSELPKVLRVDTFTNFNYSEQEFKQIDKIQEKYLDFHIFVNSNSFVEIKGKYPAIVCINPHLTDFVQPKGNTELIRAVRIKYVANANEVVHKAFNQSVRWAYRNEKPILITYMRFRHLNTLQRYTQAGKSCYYKWQKNYFRQLTRKTFDLALLCESVGQIKKLLTKGQLN